MTEQGKFIVFEGGDGSGKTTQAKMLAEALRVQNYQVWETREPGGIKSTEPIRELIMNPEVNTNSVVAFFLFEADRALHVEEIKRMIGQGYTVVCDRYEGSTFAYQYFAAGQNLPINTLREANRLATGGLKPDLTILIDLTPEEGIKRMKGARGAGELTHYDEKGLEFHQKVRDGLLRQATWPENEDNWVVIDGAGSPEEVHRQILTTLKEHGIIT